MRYFARRRLVNSVLLVLVLAAIYWLCRQQANAMQHDSFTSGYILLGAVLFLAAYSIRKRIPVLPIGNASAWLQFHIYVGLGTVFVFLMHTGFRVPNGSFERVLATLYVLVAGSGFLGLYLTRTIPKKITRLPTEYVFERIPRLRNQLSTEARDMVLATAGKVQGSVVANFYAAELAEFFERPREWPFYLFPGSGRRRRLMGKLSGIQRYCSEKEKEVSENLFSLIRRKDNLDYHYAMQLILKSWLFFHLGLTYSLLVFAFLHTVMAHAFRGTA